MLDDLLEEALEAWRDARLGVVEELDLIPAESFEFRLTPQTRSVAELACHILEVSAMMVGELARSDTDFHRLPWPQLLAHYAADVQNLEEKTEILVALRRTLEEGEAQFRAVGELHMLQLIERFDGQQGTRLAWFYHGVAQEMYHRGQLAHYARALGLVPALTRRITGES